MKIKSLIIATLYCVVTVFALSHCSTQKEDTDHDEMQDETMSESTEEVTSAPQFEVEAGFKQQLADVFGAYIALKDAFVASDVTAIKMAAAKSSEALSNVDMMLLSGVAHNDWMTYLGNMDAALKEIKSSDDLEMQRSAFSKLSDSMYKSIKAYGLGGPTAYYEYCPMAFNNQGGHWLSDVAEIRNPYFGDKMLKCGSVEEKLK